MKEKIKHILECIAKNVQIRQESSLFDKCEFWFDCDYVDYGILQSIESLSSDVTIGVIGFNQGRYYISVYGLSFESK